MVPQELSYLKAKEYFSELNFGIALLTSEEISDDDTVIWPGASFLWGKTIINDNGFIFEYSAGFAFPSIVTGKIGVGKKINETKIILGVRPYPSNLYLQSSFTNGKKGYWTVSFEYNPLDSNLDISLYSKALITLGYRWHSKKRKK
jgi:hypothetical protein